MILSRSLIITLPAFPRDAYVQVTLVAEEMSGAREVLTIKMAASGLTNIETLSKSDPFLEISRVNEGGQWLPVFRTEVWAVDLGSRKSSDLTMS